MLQTKFCLCHQMMRPIAVKEKRASPNWVLRTSSFFCMTTILVATACAASTVDNDAASIRIALRANVGVHHPQVTLGEVADLSTRDLPTLQRLMALSLGSAPRTGEPVHLDRETLARWIHARLGIETAAISWSGPGANDIHLEVRELTGEQVAGNAEHALQIAFAKESMRADISVSQIPRDITVPAGQLELRVHPLSGESLTAKHQSVWVDIWVDGSFFRTVPVGFEVSVFAPAYVLTQNLSEGQMIEPAAFVVREVEWSGRTSLPLAVSNDGASRSGVDPASHALRSRHPMRAGDALTRTGVEAVPLVTRGDYATLHTVQGAIELESRVEVLQDGSAGQAIRVKLPNASSAIVARVSGPGMVEVRQ